MISGSVTSGHIGAHRKQVLAGGNSMNPASDSVRIFSGTTAVAHLPADSRGFAYGDGVFETLRAAIGAVPWWREHWARLCSGAAKLGIPIPVESLVRAQIDLLLGGSDAVVKLTVSRGAGARGYAPTDAEPVWMLSRHALPQPKHLIEARWCRTQLALQPALAGIKHCNRLEQVLARAEWADLTNAGAGIDEGLMCSMEGDAVCATSGNLFVLAEGGWRTPFVDRCGVRGVCRDWAMGELTATEARLARDDVEGADAVFVCNAVRGILQVARLGGRSWWPHADIDRLRARLAIVNPAFAPNLESP